MLRCLLALLVAWGAAFGQPSGSPLFMPVGVDLESGPLHNPLPTAVTAWSETIHIPGATSLQIRFDRADLGEEEDYIEVTNPLDGERMVLTETVLKQWQNHSAYFNGDALLVRLVLSAGSRGEVSIGQVFSAVPTPSLVGPRLDSQCGPSDNRVAGANSAVFRMMANSTTTSGGCTGFLTGNIGVSFVENTGTFVSAGQCVSAGLFVVAQFRVPLSTAVGNVQHPAVEDQYPVHQVSVEFEDAGLGDDWAVGRLHPNALGATAVSRQGLGLAIATSIPPFNPFQPAPDVRVTGYGAEINPATLTRNFTRQTHAGALQTPLVADTVAYLVDTQAGNAGSPVILEASQEVIGVHTTSSCSSASGSVGGNQGTSILTADFAAAINRVRGNNNVDLVSGVERTLDPTFTNSVFSYPGGSGWSVIAITSSSDWDIDTETRAGSGVRAQSSTRGNSADVLAADGNMGTITPISGRIYRISGSAGVAVEARDATSVPIGTSVYAALGSTDVVRVYQFNVATPGAYDLIVDARPSWRWRLLAPRANSDWRSWGNSEIAEGTAGGTVAVGLNLNPGWHCLIVTRDGGTGANAPYDLSVALCPSQPVLALTPTPIAITADCQRFDVTPQSGRWNGVALATTGVWSGVLGEQRQTRTGTMFFLANGNLGGISPRSGSFHREPGSTANALAQEVESASVFALNAPFDTTIPAGQIAQLYEFDVPTSGSYAITVRSSTPSDGKFRVLAPGSSSGWFPAVTPSGELDFGTLETQTLTAGRHALLVYRRGTPFAAATPITVHVCATVNTTVLTPSSTGNSLSAPCAILTFQTVDQRWNVIGATGPAAELDLSIGAVGVRTPGTAAEYLISHGRYTPSAFTQGIVSLAAGALGGSRAALAPGATVALGTPLTIAWQPGETFRIFEFSVPFTDSYDLQFTDLSSVWTAATGPVWRLHLDDRNGAWRTLNDSFGPATAVSNNTLRTMTLDAGTHALVLYRNGGPETIGGNVRIAVSFTPNPVPTLSSITPTSVLLGSTLTSMTVTGTNFIRDSVVRIDGISQPTTFVNATTLTVAPLSATTATIGSKSVRVFNPGPGGGTSSAQILTVTNPSPTLSSLSPNFAIASPASQVVTLQGTNFNSTSVAHWNGAPMATVLLNSTSLSATIPAGSLAAPGTVVTITVVNPAPGGGTSSALPFTAHFPAPTLSSITPIARSAGQAGDFTLDAIGTGYFATGSQIRIGATALPTTFISATQLRTTVPASLVQAGGTLQVTVRNPAPGGGTSSAATFTVENPAPVLSAIAPTFATATSSAQSITLQGQNFNSQSVARWNGQPLTTVLQSATTLTATIPAGNLVTPGTVAQITVSNPSPAGGVSTSRDFTVHYPVPALLNITPTSVAAGQAGSLLLNVSGSGFFSAGSQILLGGVPVPTTFVNATALSTTIAPALLESAGILSVSVFNPTPGGGTSNSTTLSLLAPAITALTPSIIPIQPFGASVQVTITGNNFHAGSVVHANSDPLTTTFISPTQLTATLSAQDQPVLGVNGGLVLSVRNAPVTFSGLAVLQIGGSSNRGLIARNPIAPTPGSAFALELTDGSPGFPFTLIADLAPISNSSLYPFLNAAANYSLNVRPINPGTGDWLALLDGFGLYGLPNPAAAFDAQSRFIIPGFTAPNPTLGLNLSLQAVFVDPTAPVGYRLTWVRHADRL